MHYISPPAHSAGSSVICDSRMTTSYVPIAVGEGVLSTQYWLVLLQTEWFEAEELRTTTMLLLRCRNCDFGYNGEKECTTIEDLYRIGHDALVHLYRCKNTGRTYPLTSLEFRR